MIRPLLDPALLAIGGLVLLALIVVGAATSPRRERRRWANRLVMLLLLLAIGLRPGWGTLPAETEPSVLEVLVYVDRTTSMSAQDWNGDQSRLAGVRNDLDELMDALPFALFTVVTFGDEVETVLPSTRDAELVDETLSLLQAEDVFDGAGSLIDRPLDMMTTMLTGLRVSRPERRRVVVLMTDGENTAPEAQRSFAELEPLVDAGVVLGYGTNDAGLMPLDQDRPDAGWVEDVATGEPARSRIDEPNLRKVARELGVPYRHRTQPGGLAELAGEWRGDPRRVEDAEARAKYEFTWLIALALLLAALFELRHHWRRFWQTRRELA